MKTVTVGRMAKMFGLSRTALLYYDKIGLLRPSGRAENGYRLYSDGDIERMKQVMSLRNAGIPLEEISRHLDRQETGLSSILLKRLNELNADIERIRDQQQIIIRLLENCDLKTTRTMNPEAWMKLLRGAGVDEGTALEWHMNFERQSPERHHDLLRVLGFGQEDFRHFKAIYGSRYGPGSEKHPGK
jgi:DNA-binding transcriptional MerR regulator